MSKITEKTFRTMFSESSAAHAQSAEKLAATLPAEPTKTERYAVSTQRLHARLDEKIAGLTKEAVSYALKVLSAEGIEILKGGSRNLKNNAAAIMESATSGVACKRKPIRFVFEHLAEKRPAKITNRFVQQKVLGDDSPTQADYILRAMSKLGLGTREKLQDGLYELTVDYKHPVMEDMLRVHKS